MKVLDLQCGQQHTFEGWFGSEEDFQSQLTRGLVQCPMCGSAHITKKLSAPRFNLGKNSAPAHENAADVATKNEASNGVNNGINNDVNNINSAANNDAKHARSATSNGTGATSANSPRQTPHPTSQLAERPNMSPEAAAALQTAWLEVTKHVMAHTEDVGSSFASEARKIHYGEADNRAIRGQATPDQTMALLEEGIDVLPLPIPESLKRPLN